MTCNKCIQIGRDVNRVKKLLSWNGLTQDQYILYLIKECHMSFIDADREAEEEFSREDET